VHQEQEGFQSFRLQGLTARTGSLKTLKHGTLFDDQEEVCAGVDRVCGAGTFSLDHAVGRADSSFQRERETANRDADDPGIIRIPCGAVFLANRIEEERESAKQTD